MKNRLLISFIITLIISSCGNNKVKVENWYLTSNDSLNIRGQLIKQKLYSPKGNILKIVQYQPSNTLYLKTINYNDRGLKESEIFQYDSAKLYGMELHYKYKNKILTGQYGISIDKGIKVDTINTKFINEFDSLGRTSRIIIEKDTNIIEYQYNSNDKVSMIIIKKGSHLFSLEKFHYTADHLVKEYEMNLPDYNIKKKELNYYRDTLLTRIVLIQNEDTAKVERFQYNRKGLLTGVDIFKLKENLKEHIEIEYDYK